MVRHEAARCVIKATLETYLTRGIDHKKCHLARYNQLFAVRVSIMMGSHHHRLLTKIAGPVRLNSLHSSILAILSFSLGINVISWSSLKRHIAIALNLKIAISHHNRTTWVTKTGDRAWDKEIWKLNLEKLCLLVHYEKCTINWLYNDHRSFIGSKITD